MKKFIVTILVGCLVFGSMISVNAATSFKDLKSTNWAYKAVSTMSEKGIIKGYPDGSFKPNDTVTYGEFIKMALVASTNEDIGSAKSPEYWAISYYAEAMNKGYLGDNSDIDINTLRKPIPRCDMALIISNIIGEKAIENYDFTNSKISDVNSNSKYNLDIIKVFSLGIINGYPDGSFKPQNTLTRAESATIVYRLIDESKRIDIAKLKANDEQQKETKNSMTITSGGKQIIVDKETVKLPFRNIESIQIPKGDKWIKVKSKVPQDFMLYVDNDSIMGVGNADGTDYFYHDGYYFYYFNPYDLNLKGKNVYLRFSIDEDEKMYLIEGVSF